MKNFVVMCGWSCRATDRQPCSAAFAAESRFVTTDMATLDQ